MSDIYLIWFDILGFQKLAEDVARENHLAARKVRSDFIDVLNRKVENIEKSGKILGKKYGESDDWILAAESLDSVFEIISEILEHNTDYENCDKIPLEFAVGKGQYDPWAKFDGKELVIESSTIRFLKLNIIDLYHKWHKQTFEGKSPKSTFAVFTCSLYADLECFDKEFCKKIDTKYNGARRASDQGDIHDPSAFYVADIPHILQRGKMIGFLGKIGRSGSKLYDRIDVLYVPPENFSEIVRDLSVNRIVFLTGSPEFGKTYTAVRLLWEYYNKGYEPIWVGGGEFEERAQARKKLEEIESELRNGRIIYFEDPFGKGRYEKRENLEREIGTIIEVIERLESAYVIITSREEAFKEFEKEHMSEVELDLFEKKLNIKRPSYDNEKRKEILLKWAKAKDCCWLEDHSLKKIALNYVASDYYLPTPLSIRHFAVSSINVSGKDELIKIIEEKSRETSRSFAAEITEMTCDKFLFLLFPSLEMHGLPIDLVRDSYSELVKKLDTEGSWDFERMLTWFKEDKIDVSRRKIVFSHFSYYEAMENLLETGLQPKKREVLEKFLTEMSNKDETTFYVARLIGRFFGCVPEKLTHDLLTRISNRDRYGGEVANAVAMNFDRLPRNIQNLLFKLLEKGDDEAVSVALAVEEHFDKLPSDTVTILLRRLSDRDDRAAGFAAEAIARNFDKLHREEQNLIYKILEKEDFKTFVAVAIIRNYEKLPDDLRNLVFEFARDQEIAPILTAQLVTYFPDLPPNMQNLAFELIRTNETAASAAIGAIVRGFGYLPTDVRNLIFTLFEKESNADAIAYGVTKYFNWLPDDIRGLLFRLYERDDKSAAIVANEIARNYDKLPKEAQNLLFKALEQKETVKVLQQEMLENFERYPEEIAYALMREFIKKKETAVSAAKIAQKHFMLFSPEMKDEILLELSKDSNTGQYLAWIVAENFDSIPRNAERLLFDMSENQQVAVYVAKAIAFHYDNLPENVQNLLFRIVDRPDCNVDVAHFIAASFESFPGSLQQRLLAHAPSETRELISQLQKSKCAPTEENWQYEVDLRRIDGTGSFPCPLCGTILNPEDRSEKSYRIMKAITEKEDLIELRVVCCRCGTRIRITGFAPMSR